MLATWDLNEHDERLARAYMQTKSCVIDCGFADEIDHQEETRLEHITEQSLLRETAWVILSSGMRERTIRRLFSRISAAFFGFQSAEEITQHRERCRQSALSIFAHEGKIEAILDFVEEVSVLSFERVAQRIKKEGTKYLQEFKYLGPATSHHLAKNLGMDLPKPDRHLLRLASAAGFATPHDLCERISGLIGEKTSVVDIVLWRYATLRRDYLDLFMSHPTQQLARKQSLAIVT